MPWLVFFPPARTGSLDRRNRYALRSRARPGEKNPAPGSCPLVRNAGSPAPFRGLVESFQETEKPGRQHVRRQCLAGAILRRVGGKRETGSFLLPERDHAFAQRAGPLLDGPLPRACAAPLSPAAVAGGGAGGQTGSGDPSRLEQNLRRPEPAASFRRHPIRQERQLYPGRFLHAGRRSHFRAFQSRLGLELLRPGARETRGRCATASAPRCGSA